MKNKDKLSKPTSAGRVAGKGLSTKWGSYYTAGVRKEKKTSSESQAREVQELKAQVARILTLSGVTKIIPVEEVEGGRSK